MSPWLTLRETDRQTQAHTAYDKLRRKAQPAELTKYKPDCSFLELSSD